jgi:hypothetical protein
MRLQTTLLLLAAAVAAEDPATVAGMDAAVRGDWIAACEAFAKVEGDPKSNLRLAAARKQATARLAPAIDELTKRQRWSQLAEAAACGLLVDPAYYRFAGAAKRVEKAGIAALPAVDARIRQWGAYGVDSGTANALVEGCAGFLAKEQEKEGHWDCDKHGGSGWHDPGVTALALLVLAPREREAAERAARALLRMQDDAGCFGSSETQSWAYNTALATEALAEYALLTGQVDAYRDALGRATSYLVDAQTPGAGWRYHRRGKENDTSVTAHVTCALDAARRAGVDVPAAAFAGARAWVTSMSEPNFGWIGYNLPGGASSRHEDQQDAFPPEHTRAMVAAGSVVQVLAGCDPLQLGKNVGVVQALPPCDRYPDMYYWEFGARALVTAQGQIPSYWYAALVKSAAACRAEDGGMRACDPWGKDGGRIYATAMTALALSAPARGEGRLTARSFLETGKRALTIAGWAWEMPTGVYVESGMVLQIGATDVIVPYDDGPEIGPEGTRERVSATARPREARAPYCCLLGRVDDGEPFVIQVGKKNTMRGFGHLWLFANKEPSGDSYGWWDVTIDRVR